MSTPHLFTPVLGLKKITAGIVGDMFVFANTDFSDPGFVLLRVSDVRIYLHGGECHIQSLCGYHAQLSSSFIPDFSRKLTDFLKRLFVGALGPTFDTSSVFLGESDPLTDGPNGTIEMYFLRRVALFFEPSADSFVFVWNGAVDAASDSAGMFPDMAHGFVAKSSDVEIEKHSDAFVFWVNGAPHTRLSISDGDIGSIWDRLRDWASPSAVTFMNNSQPLDVPVKTVSV